MVAVSLRAEGAFVAVQILHELIHALTDPAVRAARAPAQQRTDGRGAGGALHRELKRVNVEVGAALVAARAPALVGVYRRWRAHDGL